MTNSQTTIIRDQVKDYYGKTLQSSNDLATNACCTLENTPASLRELLKDIHPEVKERYYGCGLTVPEAITGCRVLDLGSGSGRDCFLLSRLTGPDGSVVGVDMTDEQLELANSTIDYHTRQYGYSRPNVSFLKGFIENLEDLGLEPDSFDIVVSNCVVNLAFDKEAVLRQIYRVLKPGGEFYFSDVYSDRRVPSDVARDPVIYGECLGGALYLNDFFRIARRCGFADPRQVKSAPIEITDARIAERTGNIRFFSLTHRLFKIPDLEDLCEDYGQSVRYTGSLPGHPHFFDLDDHHRFETGRSHAVCGNTFLMLSRSRFAPYFKAFGNMGVHYGIFPDCAPAKKETPGTGFISNGACC